MIGPQHLPKCRNFLLTDFFPQNPSVGEENISIMPPMENALEILDGRFPA